MSDQRERDKQAQDRRADRLKLLRAVALVTDQQQFYEQAATFGTLAASALGRSKRSQITGLESLANSSRKVTDIFDYVKLRTARQKEWQHESFGPRMLTYMETDLRDQCEYVLRLAELTDPDVGQQQEIHMLLMRAFLAHVAAQYEYACQIQEAANDNG